jgi:hypothetical protein
MRRLTAITSLTFLLLVVFPTTSDTAGLGVDCSRTTVGLTPLMDLGSGTWLGYQGGLYPEGSNVIPPAHAQAGLDMAKLVVPRDAAGQPSATGKIVFLSIGMSNTRREFGQFIAAERKDLLRNQKVVLVNAAQNGMSAELIADPKSTYWPTARAAVQASGTSALQVQAAWLKETNKWPKLPAMPDQMIALRDQLNAIVLNLRANFPNLALVFVSSRIYAGYSTSGLSPEPHAYASGFAVKWLIEQQLNGALPAGPAPLMPWLEWGPYMWADGMNPRSDGLTWACSDLSPLDGVHPSKAGMIKVAGMLDRFLHTDPHARTWYVSPTSQAAG